MGESIFSLKRQPFKSLYIWFCRADLFLVRIPWWTLRNLLPAWRPRRSWPISWCIKLGATRYIGDLSYVVGGLIDLPTAKSLRTGPGVLGLYVDGVPQHITAKLKGWADYCGVSPARIPGYWLHESKSTLVMGEKPRLKPDLSVKREKVLLFFHGGGYVAYSAHPNSPTSLIPRSIITSCSNASINMARSFNLEYRLSTHDPKPRENPFPAALLDALAGYAYLVNDVGFNATDIIVVGDSAGGNLALALMRYLVEEDTKLAPPGALLLLSPWADMGHSHKENPEGSPYANRASDFLTPPMRLPGGGIRADYTILAFTGPQGVEFAGTNPYISPASLYLRDEDVSFKNFPPTFITCGGGELFVDQIRTLAKRMKNQMGDKAVYHEADDAIHDYIGFEWQEPQRTTTLDKIAHWVSGIEEDR